MLYTLVWCCVQWTGKGFGQTVVNIDRGLSTGGYHQWSFNFWEQHTMA